MKYGASSYIWVSPFGNGCAQSQLAHAKKLGFDIYEAAVEDPALIDAALLRETALQAGIQVNVCGAFGESRDIGSENAGYRENGMAYIARLVDMAAVLGSPYVAGPMYSAVGRTGMCDSAARNRRLGLVAENLKRTADYAGQKGVKLALEPLNRFETDLINTVEQGLELIEMIGFGNVGFLLDTFHMNIEEKSLPKAIRAAKGRIFDFHACANDRGTPGEDHFDWHAIRDALKDAGYEGPLVIESFTAEITEIAKAVSKWRPFAESPDALAKNGLSFLKGIFR